MNFNIQKKWRDVLQRVVAVHEELSELENSTARITSLQSFSKGTFSEIVSEIQKYKHIESILASLKQDIAIGASSALKTQEIKRSILDIRDLFLEVSNTFQDLDKIISMATQEDLSSIELNDSVKNINRANNIYSSISIDEINKSNVQINESLINIIEFLNLKAERLEKKRLEKERLEKERLKIERLEQERLKRERLEKERLEKERLEKERLEKERLEKERLEKERIEKERLEKERIEKERIEKERIEKERLEKERLEKERLEKERLEKERLEKERLEKERLEKERLEKERIEQERLEEKRIIRVRNVLIFCIFILINYFFITAQPNIVYLSGIIAGSVYLILKVLKSWRLMFLLAFFISYFIYFAVNENKKIESKQTPQTNIHHKTNSTNKHTS
jgi:hypothetical protein